MQRCELLSLSKPKELFSKSGPLQDWLRWLLSCGLISWLSQGTHWSSGLDSHTPTLTFIKHFQHCQDQKLHILSNLIITPKQPWLELRKLKVIKHVLELKKKIGNYKFLLVLLLPPGAQGIYRILKISPLENAQCTTSQTGLICNHRGPTMLANAPTDSGFLVKQQPSTPNLLCLYCNVTVRHFGTMRWFQALPIATAREGMPTCSLTLRSGLPLPQRWYFGFSSFSNLPL